MTRMAVGLAVCFAALWTAAAGGAPDDLAIHFRVPPDSAKAWCYWWWLNGCVSRDGIRRDLDEMKLRGVQGALVFHAGQGATPFSTEFLSQPWREFFAFAVEQAAQRGIVIGLNVCDGWNAGGPWVAEEDAAKTLIHTVTHVTGPKRFDQVLSPAAPAEAGYHDIAVVAWPLAAMERPQPPAKLTASSTYQSYGPELAADRDPATRWISNGHAPGQGPRPDRPEHLQLSFEEDFSAAAVHVVPYRQCGPRDCEFQVSTDGRTFRTIGRFQVQAQGPQTFALEETAARYFRLVVTSAYPHRDEPTWNVQISEVQLLARGEKPGTAATCRSAGMLDLTAKLDPSGRVAWDVPAGRWLLARLGWHVGARSHTKCTGGQSQLEIDPMSAGAMDRHFAATVGVLIDDVRPHVGKTFKYLHIDSGEIGDPDWTPTLRADFRRLRGYDPLPYLAAKAGQVVDDPAITERFLEDYERTVGDLMIASYYGRLGELARRHGLATHSEAAGYQKPTVDALRSMGCNDVCMSEFWARRSDAQPYIHQLAAAQLCWHDGIKNAASAAHTYGREIVQAEAFTVTGAMNYGRGPFDLKDIGDRAFCAGLNRNMLCFWICQADEQSRPGYVWPHVGMEFDRHVTWWPLGSAWLTYLARCQHLLQSGRFAADVCYLQGQWVPAYVPARWAMDPPLPPGFDCDTMNADVLADRAAAGPDGGLLLPNGQSYRYLVLCQGGRWQRPPKKFFATPGTGSELPRCPETGSQKPLALSPATLRKLLQLVQAGVTIVGPRPDRAIGLSGYPQSDVEIGQLADELWGRDPAATGDRRVGRGRVIWGPSLHEVLRAGGVAPDLEIREDASTAALPVETLCGIPSPHGGFDWIHRTIGGAEVYFIANLRNRETAGDFTFRAGPRQPELWDPVTGVIRRLPEFQQAGEGRTRVPLGFAPRQSVFVVFGNHSAGVAAAGLRRNLPRLREVLTLGGPWEVSFDPNWGGPEHVTFERLDDWTQRPEPGIRYYSGRAVYRTRFPRPPTAPAGPPAALVLDLGTVHNVAEVRVNGQTVGTVWTAPWQIDITPALRSGENALEIEVANLWPNRLIGDAALPPAQRLTTTNFDVKPDMPLLPSGLLGPVKLQAVEEP